MSFTNWRRWVKAKNQPQNSFITLLQTLVRGIDISCRCFYCSLLDKTTPPWVHIHTLLEKPKYFTVFITTCTHIILSFSGPTSFPGLFPGWAGKRPCERGWFRLRLTKTSLDVSPFVRSGNNSSISFFPTFAHTIWVWNLFSSAYWFWYGLDAVRSKLVFWI